MRRILITTAMAILFLTSVATSSFGYSFGIEDFNGTYEYGDDNFGTYLGTVYGENDNLTILAEFLEWKFGLAPDSMKLFGKTDEDSLFTPDTELNDENKIISGTWSTADVGTAPGDVPADAAVIDLLIVKGGTSFSVHQYNPAASWGEWNVGYLDEVGKQGVNIPALSHLSAYIAPTSVPEPTTLLLLGLGLVGVAGLRRKQRS